MKKFKAILIVTSVLTLMYSTAFVMGPPHLTANEEFAQKFVTSFKKKDFKTVRKMMPGPEQWRILAPKQTEGMSDAEIMTEVETSNEAKVQMHFFTLLEEARAKKIKIKEIEFNQLHIQKYYERPNSPMGMEVLFDYDHFHGKFSLTVIEFQDEWFLLDIENPDKTFETLRHL